MTFDSIRASGARRILPRLLGAIVAIALSGSACTDRLLTPESSRKFPESLHRASGNSMPSEVSCGSACTLTPGTVPGSVTKTLGIGANVFTAFDSVTWPDSFPDRTLVLMRVKGAISRAYVSSMRPSFSHLQGTPYKSIDADGAVASNYCYGAVITDFRVFGSPVANITACDRTYNNNDADGIAVNERVVTGFVQGRGKVLRTDFAQPT